MSDEQDKPHWNRWRFRTRAAVAVGALAAYVLSAGLIDGIRLTWTTNRLDAAARVVYAPLYSVDGWSESHCEPIHSAFDWYAEEWRLFFESCRSLLDDG